MRLDVDKYLLVSQYRHKIPYYIFKGKYDDIKTMFPI